MYIQKSFILHSLQTIHTFSELITEEVVQNNLARYYEVEKDIHAFVHAEDQQKLESLLASKIENIRKLVKNQEKELPLLGVSVAVKDLFHVDGFATRGGSRLPSHVLTGNEGWVIKRLTELGAWIMGKTITEEFAYASEIPTRNPHHLAHTPGGSSAGSAAAVASGMCPIAIGTQTLRSVIAPASFCGVTGFKPSYGRVPLDGCLVMSPSFDTCGMFTQDIASMKYAASYLVPEWKTIGVDKKPVLGIPSGVYMQLLEPGVHQIFMEHVKRLSRSGYTVKQVDMPWSDELLLGYDMLNLVQGEMAIVHSQWFTDYEQLYGEVVHGAIKAGQDISESQLEQYRHRQLELRDQLQVSADKEGINLWISPSQAGSAPLAGGPTGWAGMTSIWTYAGCPTLSLPLMQHLGLPLGFQCIAPYGCDEQLLAYSTLIEEGLVQNE